MQDAGLVEESFELVPLAGGVNSLRSTANGQTFHPVVGPQREAEDVHVAGTRLVERANAWTAGEFVVWDVGLGAAANALAAVAALRTGYGGGPGVRMLSFDHTLGALEFAVEQAEALGYPADWRGELGALRENGAVEVVVGGGARLDWRLCLEDFPARLGRAAELPAPQAVFYDPYSPSVNPEMWTLELFAAMRGRTRAEAPCLLTTYTRSTAVRVTLLLAGWYVGIGGATGEKDETTVAANGPGLVERPLSRSWLEGKVSASTNAAPLRAGNAVGARGVIGEGDFERLRAHPQMVAGGD